MKINRLNVQRKLDPPVGAAICAVIDTPNNQSTEGIANAYHPPG